MSLLYKEAEIVAKSAGLRPSRHGGVRLELEVMKINNKSVKVVHNYGHGGSGVTISWGCASGINLIIYFNGCKYLYMYFLYNLKMF